MLEPTELAASELDTTSWLVKLKSQKKMIIHSQHSSFREKLIEHIFIDELLKRSWLDGNCSVEVSKPEVDRKGYDIIAERGNVVRHIQLKTSRKGGKAYHQKVHTALAEKVSGCVVWIVFDEETLELGPFWCLGGKAGEALPSLNGMKVARHNKRNIESERTVRQKFGMYPESTF